MRPDRSRKDLFFNLSGLIFSDRACKETEKGQNFNHMKANYTYQKSPLVHARRLSRGRERSRPVVHLRL